jgi:hypothetical protein
MGFVTVNSPPSNAGGFVTSSHGTGGVMVCVDCRVNPVAVVLVGEAKGTTLVYEPATAPLLRAAVSIPQMRPIRAPAGANTPHKVLTSNCPVATS